MKTFIYNSFLYATERNEYLSLTRGTEIVIAIMVVTLLTENLGQLNNYYKAYGAVDNSNTSKSLSTEPASPAAAKCDSSLWKFIANSHGRFKIHNQCVSVTGTVLSVQYEPDGDTDFPFLLDTPYKNMVTKANFNPLMLGGIWSEMICQHPEQSSAVEAFKEENAMDLMDQYSMYHKQDSIFK